MEYYLQVVFFFGSKISARHIAVFAGTPQMLDTASITFLDTMSIPDEKV